MSCAMWGDRGPASATLVYTGEDAGFVAPHHKVFTAEYMGRGIKTEIESLRKRHSKICCRHLRTTFTVDAGRDDSSGIARALATREEAGDRNAL